MIYVYSISPIFHVVHSIPLSPWEEATFREGGRNGWEEGDKQDEEGEDREGARREVREGRREKGEGGERRRKRKGEEKKVLGSRRPTVPTLPHKALYP